MQLEPGIPPGESPCVGWHTHINRSKPYWYRTWHQTKLCTGILLSLNIIQLGQKWDENQWTSKLLEIRWHPGECCPLASHSSGQTAPIEPEKTVLHWHTSAVRNYSWNTRLTKTDPDKIKTGYEQVHTLMFGKHIKPGVSLPPAESLPFGCVHSAESHSLHRLDISLAGKNTAGITTNSVGNLTWNQHVQHMYTLQSSNNPWPGKSYVDWQIKTRVTHTHTQLLTDTTAASDENCNSSDGLN